jgi:hypothetical protein
MSFPFIGVSLKLIMSFPFVVVSFNKRKCHYQFKTNLYKRKCHQFKTNLHQRK